MPHKVFHHHHLHHHHNYHHHKEKVSQISECDTVNSSELKTLNISIEENIESNLKKGIKRAQIDTAMEAVFQIILTDSN